MKQLSLFILLFYLVIMSNQRAHALRLVSFNLWDLPDYVTEFISKAPGDPLINDQDRMVEIGKYINQQDFDIIGFQEAWQAGDRAILLHYCKYSNLTHNHYFDKGIVGSGLFIVSKYPIISIQYIQYPLNGKPQRLSQGDWWAGKGVGYVQIQTPMGIVHLFNTHTHSNYEKVNMDEYIGHRLDQVSRYGEYVNAITAHIDDHDLVIAMGDFNSVIDSLEMRTFLYTANMTALIVPPPSITASNGKQIDYICFRPSLVWHPKGNCSVVFRGKSTYYQYLPPLDPIEPELAPYYSDHMGVTVVFEPGRVKDTVLLATSYKDSPYPQVVEITRLLIEDADREAMLMSFNVVLMWVLWAFIVVISAYLWRASPILTLGIFLLATLVLAYSVFQLFLKSHERVHLNLLYQRAQSYLL